jgi:hypothetical protein
VHELVAELLVSTHILFQRIVTLLDLGVRHPELCNLLFLLGDFLIDQLHLSKQFPFSFDKLKRLILDIIKLSFQKIYRVLYNNDITFDCGQRIMTLIDLLVQAEHLSFDFLYFLFLGIEECACLPQLVFKLLVLGAAHLCDLRVQQPDLELVLLGPRSDPLDLLRQMLDTLEQQDGLLATLLALPKLIYWIWYLICSLSKSSRSRFSRICSRSSS